MTRTGRFGSSGSTASIRSPIVHTRSATPSATAGVVRSASREILAFNVAGRDVGREVAYYLMLYSYYLSGAVTARGVFYSQVGYAVGLYDDAMVGLPIEGVADGVLVGQEAVRADLGRSDHALAKVLHKIIRRLAVALAGAIGEDGLSGGAERNERVFPARRTGRF